MFPTLTTNALAPPIATTRTTGKLTAKQCFKPGFKRGTSYTLKDTVADDYTWCDCLDNDFYMDWVYTNWGSIFQDYMCRRCSNDVCQYQMQAWDDYVDCKKQKRCTWVVPSMKGYYGEVSRAICLCGHCDCEKPKETTPKVTTKPTSTPSHKFVHFPVTDDGIVVVHG